MLSCAAEEQPHELHPHGCLYPQGATATLHGDALVCLTSAPGSTKFDLALSANLLEVCESVQFVPRMKAEVPQVSAGTCSALVF